MALRVLTLNHRAVAALLAEGRTPEEISDGLGGSPSARQIYRLQRDELFASYVEQYREKYMDSFIRERAKANAVIHKAAESAAQKISSLVNSAKGEETQRKAANDILALAGMKAPERVEHTVIPMLQFIDDSEPDAEPDGEPQGQPVPSEYSAEWPDDDEDEQAQDDRAGEPSTPDLYATPDLPSRPLTQRGTR